MKKTRLDIAIKAAEAGGRVAMRYFRKGGLVVREKEVASDVVTQVDKESGEIIISLLEADYLKISLLYINE